MKFSSISSIGRQVLGSVLVVSGLSLAAMATGCGPAAQEAKIDESIPEVDPAAMGEAAEAALEETTPEASETPAE